MTGWADCGGSNDISTNVLSLICSRIYLQKLKDKIDKPVNLEYVERLVSDNPLDQFYTETTQGLSSKEKNYLEDNLVDISGRRASIPKANFLRYIRNGEQFLSGPTRFLQENNDRIELIHDSFCPVLEDRKARRAERWRSVFEHLLLLVVSVILVWSMYYSPKFYSLDFPKSVFFIIITIGLVRKKNNIFHASIGFALAAIPILMSIFLGDKYELCSQYMGLNTLLSLYATASIVFGIVSKPKEGHIFNFGDYFELRQFYIWCTIVLLCDMYIDTFVFEVDTFIPLYCC